ncbi:MAG TPA: N-formylglutamate deformylase [Vicinamibacterales bacterium]|nr:N-formylglutamate deformylase [Vicinamibacterales bacterium]
MTHPDWLLVTRGDAPLIVSVPHAGTDLPGDVAARLVSPWLARKDADWHLAQLYDFAVGLGATLVRTTVSRTVVDVNRDPSGQSLYPGQTTTALCPVETFDGEPLYVPGQAPDDAEIAARRARFFVPYHQGLAVELARLRALHEHVVLYDCHSIRSVIPRLFAGELPQWNIGTNHGVTCSPRLTAIVEGHCDRSGLSRVTNGRFTGGYITRHYGRPDDGVHAIQMELACRGYMREPDRPARDTWPSPYVETEAAPLRATLDAILEGTVAFALDLAAKPAKGVL